MRILYPESPRRRNGHSSARDSKHSKSARRSNDVEGRRSEILALVPSHESNFIEGM